MFLRKSFQEFLILHSEVEEGSLRYEDRPSRPAPDRVIDWRWLDDRNDGVTVRPLRRPFKSE